MAQLGRLEPVDLRECWENEASDFTPWLSSNGNLTLLGEMLGMDLELSGQEQWVGPFRADILCKDMAPGGEGEWVLIENQLERTDHGHLGQLLTYAAGLHACSIVWIARQFTDEHRAALDWLNEHTTQEIKFYGLEIQIWRIGDSAPAPRFNVVCQPNIYSRTVTARRDLDVQASSFRLKYWTEFLAVLAASPGPLRLVRPSNANWIGFRRLGNGSFSINPVINPRDHWLRVELYISGPQARSYLNWLQQHQSAIEQQLGPLEWEAPIGKRDCRIAVYRRATDPQNETDWPTQHTWIAEQAKAFYDAFAPQVRQIDRQVVTTTDEELVDQTVL